MSRRRWIADEVSGNRAALTGEHARHLAQILRAQIGQEFEISTGPEVRRGRVSGVHPQRVEFELGDAIEQAATVPVSVALSIFKFDRMEWAIEKCTELGVTEIVPLIAARSEKHLVAASEKRVERWRRIAKQAAEQSRRSAPPHVVGPSKLKDLLARTASARIVLSEVEENLMLRDAIAGKPSSLLLALGPEGGWTERELSAFRDAGWTSASLGNAILRAETAAIASIAVASSILLFNALPARNRLTEC
jgi:16S rRNA (uracil1498-N3)-methyltransferase